MCNLYFDVYRILFFLTLVMFYPSYMVSLVYFDFERWAPFPIYTPNTCPYKNEYVMHKGLHHNT